MPGENSLSSVEHVVVLMLENRSCGHMLGWATPSATTAPGRGGASLAPAGGPGRAGVPAVPGRGVAGAGDGRPGPVTDAALASYNRASA